MPKENKPIYTSFDALRDELRSVYYRKLESADFTPQATSVKRPSKPVRKQVNKPLKKSPTSLLA